jgi:ubiquinone/menaquinone biosynthesis C-methylase UbiE
MLTRRLLLALALAPALSAQPVDPQHEQRLKIPDVIRALDIRNGSRVADVGAGGGTFTVPLSRAAGPDGRVYAVDIDAKYAIPALHKLVRGQKLRNVTVIHSRPADPELPGGSLDAVLMVIAYHEIEPHQQMLASLKAALKPGGRLVVVDMNPNKTLHRPRADQTRNHVISPDLAESEFRAAGFDVVSRDDRFIDWPDEENTRWMMVCTPRR